MSVSRRLEGRVAVITGGAQGIGLGIATRLAEEGATVVLADIKQTEAEGAAARLMASGLSAVALPVDIGQHESVKALAAEVDRRFGRCEILVNNTAIQNLIREGKSTGLRNTMETGVKEGMCLMDNVVFGLAQERKISPEVARANIANRVLRAKLN